MAVQVPNLFAEFMAGRDAREAQRARAQQGELQGLQTQALRQRLEAQPAEMAADARLRELQTNQAQQQLDQGKAQFESTQETENAKRTYAKSQYVLKSPKPKATVEANFPEFVQQIQQSGRDWSTLTDDDVRSMAEMVAAKSGSIAGIAPPKRLEDVQGPGGSLLQRDPTTGELKQVIGREPQDRTAPVQAPPVGYRFAPDGKSLEKIPGGPADKPTTLRTIPPAIAKGIVENRQQLRKIDEAIASAESYPGAFGMQNYLGDGIQQRIDPNGVEGRARISDIGSLKINDRSGAAVSAKEFPRLQPFIPTATDSPETVKKKLGLFRAEVAAMQEDLESSYSEQTGYQGLPAAGKGASGNWDDKPAGPSIAPGQTVNMGGFTVTRKR